MSIVVCIHKYIRNGCIEIVTCTFKGAVFDAVRNNQLDHKILFMKEASILPFGTWREQRRRKSTLTE